MMRRSMLMLALVTGCMTGECPEVERSFTCDMTGVFGGTTVIGRGLEFRTAACDPETAADEYTLWLLDREFTDVTVTCVSR